MAEGLQTDGAEESIGSCHWSHWDQSHILHCSGQFCTIIWTPMGQKKVSEVPSFQRVKCMQEWLGWEKVSYMYREVSSFQRALLYNKLYGRKSYYLCQRLFHSTRHMLCANLILPDYWYQMKGNVVFVSIDLWWEFQSTFSGVSR